MPHENTVTRLAGTNGQENTGTGLRLRAFIIGIPLVLAVCMLSVYANLIAKSVQIGTIQIASPAIVVLAILILLNMLCARLCKKRLLSAQDMVVIYAMMLVGVLLSTRGLVEKLIPPLAYLPYYTSQTNQLNQLITQHLPEWALPFSPSIAVGNIPPAIQQYYEGLPPGAPIPWGFWIGPVLTWFSLIALTLFVFACLATLLRRQWMDNEQLRFPLTILPLTMITPDESGEPLWGKRLFWIGFGVAVVIFGFNGLHSNIPEWPQFVIDLRLNNLFTERPWNAMGPVTLYVSLAALGFAYFLPTDLLFSVWFFFLLTRYQDILTVQFGGIPTPMNTHYANVWNSFQSAGAYVVLVAAQVRIGWPYYRMVWQSAWAPPSKRKLDDSDELMSYRVALLGLVGGFAGIILWLVAAGMSPAIAAAQMGIYLFIVAVIMTRAVSEGGWLITETSFLPSHLISLCTPLAGLGGANNALLGFSNALFTRDMRGVLLSPLMDIQKMAKETNLSFRALRWPLLLALLASFMTATSFFLYLAYTKGALTFYENPNANARNMLNFAANDIRGTGFKADSTAYGGFVVGVVATVAMIVLRSHFAWFPLNPLAYAIVPSFAGFVLWFPFFLAWVLKCGVMKFGGIEAQRKLAPLMLGLILGDFTMQVFWALMVMTGHGSAPFFALP